jgi:hypothetical protein
MSLDTPLTEIVDQPIVIRTSKWKLFLMSLLSLAFALAGILTMSTSHSSRAYYAGLATLILFGLLGLPAFLFQMFTPSLRLIIDGEGIHHFYPFRRPLTIKWEEIYSIYAFKICLSKILMITVSSTGRPAYIARNYQTGKIPFTLRKAESPVEVISLPLTTATLSYTKAIALIQERYAAQIKQYQIYIQKK